MKFEGSFEVNKKPEELWDIITNPERFAEAIPDLKSLKVKDSGSFTAEFKVKLGMIGGTIKMDFKYEDLQPPTHLRIAGHGSGVQSVVDLKIDLNIKPAYSGSKIDWSADLSVGGLAASLGGRLIEGVTKDKVNEIIKNLKKVVEK